MNCELCEVAEASVTIIPTGEGMPQSVCSPCMARMGLALAKELLEATEIAATLGPLFVTPAREDLHDGAKAEAKRRTRKKTPEAQADEGQAGRPPEASAAAADE